MLRILFQTPNLLQKVGFGLGLGLNLYVGLKLVNFLCTFLVILYQIIVCRMQTAITLTL